MEAGVLVSTSSLLQLVIINQLCAFRILVSLDRVLSATLGRPCAIQDEEYVVQFNILLIWLFYDCSILSQHRCRYTY